MAKYRELKKKLQANGFVFIRNSKGSHEQWKHPNGTRTTLPRHSTEVTKFVERSILKAIRTSKGDQNE